MSQRTIQGETITIEADQINMVGPTSFTPSTTFGNVTITGNLVVEGFTTCQQQLEFQGGGLLGPAGNIVSQNINNFNVLNTGSAIIGAEEMPITAGATQPRIDLLNTAYYQVLVNTGGIYTGTNFIQITLMKFNNMVLASFIPQPDGNITLTASGSQLTIPAGSIPPAFIPTNNPMLVPTFFQNSTVNVQQLFSLAVLSTGDCVYGTDETAFTVGDTVFVPSTSAIWTTNAL